MKLLGKSDYNIRCLVCKHFWEMPVIHVAIQSLQSKMFELAVKKAYTVKAIKRMILEKLDIEPARQRLIYNGKNMYDDESRLVEYGVSDKDIIVLMQIEK